MKCRWIDKAASIESSFVDGQECPANLEESSSCPGNGSKNKLCSAAEVKKVKRLLTLIPLWTACLMYSLVLATGDTFFVAQSVGMNNEGFIKYFFTLRLFLSSITSTLLTFLIKKKWNNVAERQRATLVRIGVGMALSVLCCFVAWRVEVRRLKLVKCISLTQVSGGNYEIDMSISWLAPQFIMLGLTEGFVDGGLSEFFTYYVDKPIKNFEAPFNGFVLGIQRFLGILFVLGVFRNWIADTTYQSHLDKYFLILAILSSGYLFLHGYVSYRYASMQTLQKETEEEQHQ